MQDIHRVIDGKPGQLLNSQIEQKLRSHVVGPYLDLGHFNWYSTSKPIATLADLKGMKIRNSGGAGQAWRARFVGAIPNTTAWPNVPLSLSQGTFDGLVSSNESLVSAKLWEAGVKYALEDHQFIAEYIPLVNQAFWDKLGPDLQKIMTETWAQSVPAYRENSVAAQRQGRKTLEEHGVKFVDPTGGGDRRRTQAHDGGAGPGGEGDQGLAADAPGADGHGGYIQLSGGGAGSPRCRP